MIHMLPRAQALAQSAFASDSMCAVLIDPDTSLNAAEAGSNSHFSLSWHFSFTLLPSATL